ncbi:hypothetical protein FM119_10870 [Mycetocola reblochoni REB411]|uniref:Uncharacterized protein n=1 Tax=Mycetocola reblochoni REB411 TaxID=1255698 RepID=A0A1R4K145_9MICO|nr:hypothetical protein FM119_10870 [Mycetocola reblochoni REB411]
MTVRGVVAPAGRGGECGGARDLGTLVSRQPSAVSRDP